jgi:hypothetical protein
LVSKQRTQVRTFRLISKETTFLQIGIHYEVKCKGCYYRGQPFWFFLRLDAFERASSFKISNESSKCKQESLKAMF